VVVVLVVLSLIYASRGGETEPAQDVAREGAAMDDEA
jgi:hypothetical protein